MVDQVQIDNIARHFEDLEDPRSDVNLHHPLISVLTISLMAVLAGAAGPTAIARWAMLKADELLNLLPLPNGIPKKDVYRRVLCTLKPDAFQICFASWLQSLRDAAAAATGVDQPILAVDGKTLRRSHDRSKGVSALHSVSVWATEFGLTLGQVATDQKSNEITAIPEVLKLVDIKGAIVTIDAMGTQKAIAAQIVESEADYVFGLKGNQSKLHDATMNYVVEQWENDFADASARRYVTTEKEHGREETRTYIQMPAPTTLPGFHLWKGLLTIGLVVHDCLRNGKETHEVRYYISSLAMGVKRFAYAVRSHWGIENSCHWSLDVTYREDESRIRDVHMRENFAWLNRFTLSLLKQHPGKESIVMKRRSCGWDFDFMTQVLAGTKS
jgi:predicted transposase YbfD/YdcC